MFRVCTKVNAALSCSIIRIFRFYHSKTGYFGYQPKQFLQNVQHPKVQNAIEFFRHNGYKYARINPLTIGGSPTLDDVLDEVFFKSGDKNELKSLLQHLKSSYCGEIAFEIEHIQLIEKDWFYEVVENNYKERSTIERQKRIFQLLMNSQVFENFLGKKFPTLKRYSSEGCESMLAFFDELLLASFEESVEDILLSIPHRGRLSLLTGLLQFPHSQLFHKIKGNPEFESTFKFTGDVISHLACSINDSHGAHTLHVTMLPNPSHLEASHPVVMGKTRSRLLTKKYGDYGNMENRNKVLSVLVHGDAAMAGQGIVMESLCLSQLPNFDVGGSIHLVVNNQVGFTTPYDRGSSMAHCSDIMKMVGYPIIHVNGDSPEEVAKSARIALNYRNRFNKDIIINMHCFRRWGHNEIDDPTYTNPGMYKTIYSRSSVPDLYKNNLLNQGIINENDVKTSIDSYEKFLNDQLNKSDEFVMHWSPFKGNWNNMKQPDYENTTTWDTGFDVNLLKMIASKSVEVPSTFSIHSNLEKNFCKARLSKMEDGSAIDWATAEALAVGSLIMEGNFVRICGQDVGRGTFSHRHFMFVDQQTEEIHIPLNYLSKDQTGFLEVVNSPLSEEAVLAYEYGVSIENPNHLVVWEAQFGDFFNGAQIIIDTFISSGEIKWLLQSGLVLLLPHGMDGAGPDHSSCKLERFLQLSDSSENSVDSDNVNMQIVNPTTPAQYFHLLRRQQVRNFRKPLIVASPKLILRMSAATSSLNEMQEGTYFKPVIGDTVPPASVEKVVFCSGKHFYELEKERNRLKAQNLAIIRLESLVPFPAEEIKEIMKGYKNAKDFIWSQEEHRNQGAWSFVNPRFENLISIKLRYVGRPVLGASSVGVAKWHADECKKLFNGLFSA